MKMNLSKLFEEAIKEEYRQNNKYGYLTQMSILVSKSLIPSTEDLSIRINYKRYIKEMDLWMDYRSNSNESLLNMKKLDSDIYWTGEDVSILYRIIPLVITNIDEEVLISEIIKNVLFTTGNLKELFKYISIGYLMYSIVNKVEDKEEGLKDKIIKFSQKDFLDKYSRFYRLRQETYPKNYTVDFEKEKIGIINLFNGIHIQKYNEISDILAVEGGKKPETFVGNILYNFISGSEEFLELPGLYKNMGNYLMNLRNGKISPAALKVEEYILPDIFEFQVGEKFYHTLLNDSEVLKKEEKNGVLSSLVRTKTGIYLFRR